MPERRSRDYVRHGITTLFAALDVATGEVIGSIHRRHRAAEFKKFLIKLDNQVPAGLDVHLIGDNSATHKSPPIATWLTAHPQIHLHFTPTYSSWLKQIERWFRAVDRQATAPRRPHIGLRVGKRRRDWIKNWALSSGQCNIARLSAVWWAGRGCCACPCRCAVRGRRDSGGQGRAAGPSRSDRDSDP